MIVIFQISVYLCCYTIKYLYPLQKQVSLHYHQRSNKLLDIAMYRIGPVGEGSNLPILEIYLLILRVSRKVII